MVPSRVKIKDSATEKQKRGDDAETDRAHPLRWIVDIPQEFFQKA